MPARFFPVSATSPRGLHLILLTVAGVGLFLVRLGTPGLMDPDEGRYAEIAREMLLLRDWLIPRLNFLPYLEKPPLGYWLTALNFAIFGLKEWAARLPSALSALAGLYLAYGLGRALWGARQGFWGALVLATMGGYLVMGRLLTLDMAFTFFLNLGIALGYLALSRNREHLWPWAFGALALAVMVKGPVALVLAGLIGLAGALLQGPQALRALVRPRCLALLAVLMLPWFLYVAWRYPPFPRFFLWEHHVERYLDGARYHAEPWWYFGPVLLAFLLPWTGLLPWVLGHRGGPDYRDRWFLVLWAVLVLAFFSVSRGKLAPYILPALLPLALLMGEKLAAVTSAGRGLRQHPGLRLTLGLWALFLWVLAALYFFPPPVLTPWVNQAAVLAPYPGLFLMVLALTPTAALLFRRVEWLLAGALLLGALLPLAVERLALQRSPREVGLTLKAQWRPGDALVGIFLYSQAVSFYSGQAFHLLDFRTELDFGKKLAPEASLIFKTKEELAIFAGSRPRVFYYLKEPDLPRLKAYLPTDYEIVARHRDCLLVAAGRKYP